jgi:hypothetical protein
MKNIDQDEKRDKKNIRRKSKGKGKVGLTI